MRTIAVSAESCTLIPSTWTCSSLSSLTTWSNAPTRLARKIENCVTRGPPSFSVVAVGSVGIRLLVAIDEAEARGLALGEFDLHVIRTAGVRRKTGGGGGAFLVRLAFHGLAGFIVHGHPELL